MGNTVAKSGQRKMPLTFNSDNFDGEKYAKVANSARLVEIALVDQLFKVSLSSFWDAEEERKTLAHGYWGEPLKKLFDTEVGTIAGGYSWNAQIKDGRSKPLRLKAEYFLLYSGLNDLDSSFEEYVHLYFDKVARFTSYPYFRTLFATSSSNAGLALAPLPSLVDRID